MALADTAGAGLWNAFTGGQREAQQEGTANLQNLGMLQGILDKVRQSQQEQAYRGALGQLGPNATTDQLAQVAAQFGGPKEILAHADRVAGQNATKEMAMARLTQAKGQNDAMMQFRMARAQSEDEKRAILAAHQQVDDQIKAETTRYTTGANIIVPNYPAMTSAGGQPAAIGAAPALGPSPASWTPAPVGTPQSVIDAAAQIKSNLAQGGQGGTIDLGVLPPARSPTTPATAQDVTGVSPVEKAVKEMPPEIARLPRKMQDKWLTDNAGGGIEETAKGIANYTIAPLSSFAMARPLGAQVMGRVKELNPEYDSRFYNASNAAEKAFTSGKQGDTVRSFNVAINHLGTLKDLAKGLDNGDIQVVNRVAQSFAQQTGETAPTSFDAAKKIVGDEIAKAIIGSRGALGDREATAATISRVSSPKQLAGVIDTFLSLMNGQLGGLRKQYEASTRKTDFNDRFLTPEGAAQVSGGVPEFATEADAIASGKKGKVKIGGRNANIQ